VFRRFLISLDESMSQSDLEFALKSHVTQLCASERNTGNCPEGLERAEKYLREAFQGLGYQVTRQEFRADGVTCANIEAIPSGFVGYDKPHIIIGAHYDSAPGTPGADDNASAVAILLELARRLVGKPCARSLRFVAYTNEEPPHFCSSTMGSVVHAKACRKRGDKITGMICLESLGVFTDEPGSQSLAILGFLSIPAELDRLCRLSGVDPAVGNFLAIVGNEFSRDFLNVFDSAFDRDARLPALATDFMGDFLRLSDHLSYWDEGYPAIMLTDTAMCRNTHYHRPSDTPEKLNYAVMALLTLRIARAIEAIQKPPV
jgi:hypothetical protein